MTYSVCKNHELHRMSSAAFIQKQLLYPETTFVPFVSNSLLFHHRGDLIVFDIFFFFFVYHLNPEKPHERRQTHNINETLNRTNISTGWTCKCNMKYEVKQKHKHTHTQL